MEIKPCPPPLPPPVLTTPHLAHHTTNLTPTNCLLLINNGSLSGMYSSSALAPPFIVIIIIIIVIIVIITTISPRLSPSPLGALITDRSAPPAHLHRGHGNEELWRENRSGREGGHWALGRRQGRVGNVLHPTPHSIW